MRKTPEERIDADQELENLLRRYPPPAPPPGLFERAVGRARELQEQETGRRRRGWSGFGSAVAAGLVVLAAVAWFAGPGRHGAAEVPTVTMSLYEPETVRLVFAADVRLADATMTVTLPAGVELEGFPGEREVAWETSLDKGRNLLPLTLVATGPAGGELTARLAHHSRDRTFRLRIDIG